MSSSFLKNSSNRRASSRADLFSSLLPLLSDAIAAAGFAHELANYGEYSGAPTEGQTYEYAKTIREFSIFTACRSRGEPISDELSLSLRVFSVSLITRGDVHPDGKILIIGGGIANFTNVASTFKGIIKALREVQQPLIDHKVKIFVRRGGTSSFPSLPNLLFTSFDLR